MKLRVLFVDYSADESGAMPNAMIVTDEYMEENMGETPPHWDAGCLELASSRYPQREAFITVPDSFVRALFVTPTVEGTPG